MKNLLPILTLTTASVFCSPVGAFAKDEKPGPPPEGAPKRGEHMDPAERLKMMTEKLKLTQDQQDKIKAILEKNAPAIKEIMSKGRENLTEADKEKLKELMKGQKDAIGEVLTPEQKEKMKEERGGHKPGGPGGPGGKDGKEKK